MAEYLSPVPDPGPWPGAPRGPGSPGKNPGKNEENYAAGIARITAVLGDTRRLALICGALLAADVAGVIVTGSALLRLRHDAVTISAAVLLLPAAAAWLTAALLLVLAEQPVAGSLSQLRYDTGAPADPSAPWPPLGVPTLADADLESRHIAPLIGAAALVHARTRRALLASVIATAGFLLWTAISLAIAAAA